MIEPPKWDEIHEKLPAGSLVSCIVTRHAPYGVFASIPGLPFDGLIQITDFKDEGRVTADEFPAIGSTLTAVVLGFKETGQQIWLGVKPSQIDSVDQPKTGPRNRMAVPVGLGVGSDGRFEFFGLVEVNSFLKMGAELHSSGPDVNPTAASRLFQRLDRELWLVTAQAGPRRGGLIATFVSQASLVPDLPRVLVGLAQQHFTRELVEQSSAFGLHLLGEEHLDWVWRFGLRSGRDLDKLDGLASHPGPSGSPLLTEARGWLDCRVEARLDTGDRTVYLAEVLDARPADSRTILTLNRLIQAAPAERRRELQEQILHDSVVDAAAILQWRRMVSDS